MASYVEGQRMYVGESDDQSPDGAVGKDHRKEKVVNKCTAKGFARDNFITNFHFVIEGNCAFAI